MDVSRTVNKRIIFTMGGKGGPGKTRFASSFVDFLDEQKCSRILIDCDIENKRLGSLAHLFPDAAKLDISTKKGLDEFIDCAFANPSEVVLADMGAGSGKWTFDWFDKMYGPVSEAGVKFLAIGVITSEYATAETLINWAEALQDRVDYLVVRNHKNGNDFDSLHSTAGKQFLEMSNAPVIDMEERLEDIQHELDKRGLTLRQALNAPAAQVGELLSKDSVKMRMRGYFSRMNAQFMSVLDTLLP